MLPLVYSANASTLLVVSPRFSHLQPFFQSTPSAASFTTLTYAAQPLRAWTRPHHQEAIISTSIHTVQRNQYPNPVLNSKLTKEHQSRIICTLLCKNLKVLIDNRHRHQNTSA